jgi:four helix bundle protein
MKEKNRDLSERLLEFTVNTFKFLNSIPNNKEYNVFRYQLSKSSSSIGANYEESQASSKNEFKQRIAISLREARETNYWFRVIDKLKLGDYEQRKYLLQESKELKLIFGSIHTKCFKSESNG